MIKLPISLDLKISPNEPLPKIPKRIPHKKLLTKAEKDLRWECIVVSILLEGISYDGASANVGKPMSHEVWKNLESYRTGRGYHHIHRLLHFGTTPFPYILSERCDFTLENLQQENQSDLQHLGRLAGKHMFYALEYMHSRGWAHQDVKPCNIFYVVREGKFYLADFGVATNDDIGSSEHEVLQGTPYWYKVLRANVSPVNRDWFCLARTLLWFLLKLPKPTVGDNPPSFENDLSLHVLQAKREEPVLYDAAFQPPENPSFEPLFEYLENPPERPTTTQLPFILAPLAIGAAGGYFYRENKDKVKDQAVRLPGDAWGKVQEAHEDIQRMWRPYAASWKRAHDRVVNGLNRGFEGSLDWQQGSRAAPRYYY